LTQIGENPPTAAQPFKIAIVGGGAGGVELALNISARLGQDLQRECFQVAILHRGARLMTGHNRRVAQYLNRALHRQNVAIYCQETVVAVERDRVHCDSGRILPCDAIFWVTQATAPDWLTQSDLETDDRGFILVRDTLQSVSHPHIFAAGDIATMGNHPRPKAGVYAVRQGLPLAQNLRRILQNQPLQPFRPQKRYLALIGTGEHRAVASWGKFAWESAWLWHWKDHIDRAFMTKFSDLPAMSAEPESAIPRPAEQPEMYCSGCGSKVGANLLQQVLSRLELSPHPDAIIALDRPDDAAVLRWSQPESHLVQSIDHFRAPVRDPWQVGQIAAIHALSDLWAMGATPQTVLASITLPYATDAIAAELLYQTLSGILQALSNTGAHLVGGHTSLGSELAIGLACTGHVPPEHMMTKTGLQPGQTLILTKPLGIGTLLAAHQRHAAKGRWVEGAIATMRQSNQAAAQICRDFHIQTCTDITGFGLLGHLLEMVGRDRVQVTLFSDQIPVLDGAFITLRQGITSSLQLQNRQALSQVSGQSESVMSDLLCDPQTSGGFLLAVESSNAHSCRERLQKTGYEQAAIVGEVKARSAQDMRIHLKSIQHHANNPV
jgi:selenide,water dikinase